MHQRHSILEIPLYHSLHSLLFPHLDRSGRDKSVKDTHGTTLVVGTTRTTTSEGLLSNNGSL